MIGLSVRYHVSLHEFREERGTRTVSFKAKLIQNLTEMREEILFKVFLDSKNITPCWIRSGKTKLWWCTELVHVQNASAVNTGRDSPWQPGWGANTSHCSRDEGGSHRDILCHPPY